MLLITGSIVNMFGGGGRENLYDHLISTKIFTLEMNKIFT